MYYKLTDQKMQTRKGYQWELGKWNKVSGKGGLCSDGWLHCYNSPLLAVLLNPTHANIRNPRLFEIEVKGKKLADNGLKFGFTDMRLVAEVPAPKVTRTQRVAFAILCAKQVYKDNAWNKWADNWLSGANRSYAAARAADAADYARVADAAYAAADAADDAAYAAADAADAADDAADAADDAAHAAARAAYAAADAAHAADDAAYADAAPVDLIKIAEQAMTY